MATTKKNYQIIQKIGADEYLLLHPETNAENVLVEVEGLDATNASEAIAELNGKIPTKTSELTNDGADGTNVFATVKQVEDALANATGGESASDVKTLVENHKADTNNPHKVTASQVGAATTAELEAEETARSEADTALGNRIATIEGYKIPDTYATKDEVSSAVAGVHSHDNKAVLDGISAEKVSAWDAAEQNAKDYADGLAGNYDSKGSAAQALTDAKSYTDTKMNEFVAAYVTDDGGTIDKLEEIAAWINNDEAGVSALSAAVTKAQETADKGVADAATAKSAADAAQKDVDALETAVGAMYSNDSIDSKIAEALQAAKDYADANDSDTVYDDTALAGRVTAVEESVDAMYSNGDIDSKVAQALADAKAYADENDANTVYDDTALAARVTAVEGEVDAIQGDYLKAADKTELAGDIADNASAIAKIVDGTTEIPLKDSGVTAGSYSAVTVDAKGRVTAGAQFIEVGSEGQESPSASLAIGGLFFKVL